MIRVLSWTMVMGLSLAAAGCAARVPRPEFVYFDAGLDRVRSEYDEADIARAAHLLEQKPHLSAAIIGYASSEGGEAENKKLSFRRAEHIRDLIARKGIAAERLALAARGSSDPAATNFTPEGRAKNRRVEIFFYDPKLGVLEAQYGAKIEVRAP